MKLYDTYIRTDILQSLSLGIKALDYRSSMDSHSSLEEKHNMTLAALDIESFCEIITELHKHVCDEDIKCF